MQIVTLGQGLHNPKVCALASEVATTALTCAAEVHVYHAIPGKVAQPHHRERFACTHRQCTVWCKS